MAAHVKPPLLEHIYVGTFKWRCSIGAGSLVNTSERVMNTVKGDALGPTQLYGELNKQFFGGRLPRFRVTLSKRVLWHGVCHEKRRLIQLRRGLNPEELRQTLLHEMCHIGTDGHGPQFQAKLDQLASQGEKWAVAEVEMYRRDSTSWNDAMAELREQLSHMAVRFPRPRFSRVVSLFARGEFKMQPRELLRRAPWLRAAWRKECRKVDRRTFLIFDAEGNHIGYGALRGTIRDGRIELHDPKGNCWGFALIKRGHIEVYDHPKNRVAQGQWTKWGSFELIVERNLGPAAVTLGEVIRFERSRQRQ